jgi:hypothetical protein
MKSRLEKDRCIFCGNLCETVDIKRSGQYYVGYALMGLGAAVIVLARLWLNDDFLLWLGGILMVIMGAAVVLDANSKMSKKAAELANKNDGQEDD